MEPRFIPPVANRKKASGGIANKIIVVLVILVALLAVGAGVMMITSTSNPAPEINKLNSQMSVLTDIVATGKNARNPDLVKTVSDARIIINGDATALKSALAAEGTKESKELAATTKAESKKLTDLLQSAAVDGRYDQEFVPILTTKLRSTQALIRGVSTKVSRPATRTALKNVDDHFTMLLESLAKLQL